MIVADNTIKELQKFSSDIVSLNGKIGDDRIENFEKKLGLKLPEDYKYIIKKVNGFSLMGTEVLGIYPESKKQSLEVVYNREHNEVENPQYPFLVPFSDDGRGNFYCFDIRTNSKNSCNIIFWQSDYPYNDEDVPEITHESFVDWVNDVMIGWTLEDYDYDGNEK